MNWYVNTDGMSRAVKAHILTNKHLGYGWYETACGKSIHVEYRLRITDDYARTHNVKKCRICQKAELNP